MIANSRKGHRGIAVFLLAVAVVCIGLAVYYLVVKTTFLASPPAATHWKHALLFAAIAVVALFAANIAWRHKAA